MPKPVTAVLLFALAVALCVSAVAGQTPEGPPSISSAKGSEFVSKDGLFRIELATPPDEMVWTFAEGEIRMGFFDYFWAVTKVDDTSFEFIADEFNRDTLSKRPGRVSEKEWISKTDPYHLVSHFTFTDGSFGVQSHRMYGKRYYSILASFSTLLDRQKFETVLSSFEVTGEVDIEAVVKRKIQGLTLSSLPQSPVAKGENTDAVDERLKGSVSRIVEETESSNSERSSESKRFITEIREYDRRGYLVKKIETGQYGLPYSVELWGFVDRKRVMKRGFTLDRYSLFDPYIAPPLVEGPNKPDPSLGYDPRYFLSFKKSYKAGRAVEYLHLDNAGRVNLRRVSSYTRNVMTTTTSGPGGEFRFKTVVTLDKNGLPIEEVYHHPPEQNTVPTTTAFTYTFDRKGNWTKKIFSLVQKEYGKLVATPQFTIHRTITYH